MRIALIALAASTIALGGCATTPSATSAADGMGAADVTPEVRTGYVTQAGASDLFEIQSSQLALTKAQRPEVREFAQTMITHHTQTTAALTAAAGRAG